MQTLRAMKGAHNDGAQEKEHAVQRTEDIKRETNRNSDGAAGADGVRKPGDNGPGQLGRRLVGAGYTL